MALTSSDSSANGFNSMVRDAWLSREAQDLFTQRSPLLKMLQLDGNIKPSGYGIEMREPLLVPVLTGPQLEGVSNAFADRNAAPLTGYTSAKYALSEYIINFAWEHYQEKEAGGEVEMVRMKAAHFKNVNLRSFNQILADLWAAPEGANTVGVRNQLASLRTFFNGGSTAATDGGANPPAQAEQSVAGIVSATGAVAQTLVGKIERSAAGAAYWCTPLLGTAGTSVALTILVLNDLYEAAFQDGYEPNLIIMPPGLNSKLQNLLTVGGGNGGQMYGESKLAKFGFSSLRYRNADIVIDRRCPTAGFYSGTSTAHKNVAYCLNTKMLNLRADGKTPKFRDVPSNRPIEEWVGEWSLALTSGHLGNVASLRPDLIQ